MCDAPQWVLWILIWHVLCANGARLCVLLSRWVSMRSIILTWWIEDSMMVKLSGLREISNETCEMLENTFNSNCFYPSYP